MPEGHRECVDFLRNPPPEFEPWSAWYDKYLDRDVFKYRGVEVEGKDVRSRLFREWFKMEQVTYLGKVNRFSRMNSRETVNSSFVAFCEERGIKLPAGYRQVSPNPVAEYKSISKYDKVQPVLDVGAWALAGEWTKNHFQAAMSGSRVLSQEVVLGEMDKSTSCGYPWNLQFKDKSDFLADFKARCALEDFWTLLGLPEDECMVPIWACSQKCEMRTPEKIADNNLRTFLVSPFEHSCSLNRMCLDMNNKFYDSANDVDGFTRSWSVVGASKFMGGWDNLYRRLDRHPNAFELDESAFDSSLFAEALLGQMEIRWSFLREEDRTPENRLRLERLYASIIDSVIVLENGELIQKHTGNPSGSSNTIVDNTMILFRLFAYAWIVLCKKGQRAASYEEFMREVEAALCGDDNTFTVSDEVVAWFNPITIAAVWCGIGVTTKTPCDQPRPLSEVQFLSQGFAFHHELGMWVPVPETERVLSSLMYGSDLKEDDVRWHYLRACALRMDSWGNPECRSVIASYLEYLNAEYRSQLIGAVDRPKGPITMASIMSNWKSDAWIESLYCGCESKERVDGVMNHDASFKNFYQQLQESLQCKSTLDRSNMPKSAAAKARRAAKRRGKQLAYASKQSKGPKRGPIFRNPQPVRGMAGAKKKKRARAGKLGRGPLGVSMMSDGVNVGSVWKNTTAERVTFPVAREKFADLTSTGVTFQMLQQLYLNPGNSTLFPVFSQIAKQYEEYVPHHLKIFYRTEEYMASGSVVSAGLAALGTNFDPDAPNFATMTELENYTHSISGPPFSGIICHDVLEERRRRGSARGGAGDLALKNYFVHYGPNQAAPSGQASKFYDVGNFQCAVNGTQAGVIGELWIEYGFTMIRRLQQPGAPLGGVAHFSSVAPTTADNFVGAVLQSGNTLSGITVGSNVITFPAGMPGNYLVSLALGASTSASNFSFTGGGLGLLNLLTNAGVRNALAKTLSASTSSENYTAQGIATYTVPATGGTITLTPSTLVGGDAMDLFIFALPSTVLTVDEAEQVEISELQLENIRLNDRLARIEEMLAGGPPVLPQIRRLRAEEGKHQDEEESPVYVSARGALKVRV